MRAAYAVLVLGVIGGLVLATIVLSTQDDRPTTVAGALGIDGSDSIIDRTRATAVGVLVAECMRRHGIPWAAVPEAAPFVPDAGLEPAAWARRWGFGVSTMVGSGRSAAGSDPNLAALEAAPAVTQATWRRALHGDGATPGCQETANGTVYGLRERLLRPLRPGLDALDATIGADPATARAVAAWASCVTPVTDGSAADRGSLPRAMLERYVHRVIGLAGGTRSIAGLAAVQADERRVAELMATCELAFAAARAAAAAPHEAAFVAEHWDALRAIGSTIRSAEAAQPTLAP